MRRYQPPNKIPQEEYDKRVNTLMSKLVLTERTKDNLETNELFELYNDRNVPRENDKHCSQCRSRVYQRMKRYYESIKGA